MSPGTRLWHGGIPGLRPGDLLLPPAETGHVPWRLETGLRFDGMDARDWLGPDVNRADRVYLTTDRELARAYAGYRALHTGMPGALYIAGPAGDAGPDPDLPEVSVQCARARVVKVYDPAVVMTARQVCRQLARHISAGATVTGRAGR